MSLFKSQPAAHPYPDQPTITEETLRLLAQLPAPVGLEKRVLAELRAELQAGVPAQAESVSGLRRVLAWPQGPSKSWVQAPALRAAAIACLAAGVGWGIYARMQPTKQVGVPPSVASVARSSFSSSGAMRKPETLTGPQVPASAVAATSQAGTPPVDAVDSTPQVAHGDRRAWRHRRHGGGRRHVVEGSSIEAVPTLPVASPPPVRETRVSAVVSKQAAAACF